MSADQLRRAADAAATTAKHEDYATGKEMGDATAALLRAAADEAGAARDDDAAQLNHFPWRVGCRIVDHSWLNRQIPGPCLACLLDDVAAAYLGEETQP